MKTITNKQQQADLTVAWETPLGVMTGVIGERGVKALRFPKEEEQTLEVWPDDGVQGVRLIDANIGGEELSAHPAESILASVTIWLWNYFACQPGDPLPPLDFTGASPFDRAVWEATAKIPRGETKTYGQIAGEIGRPGSARAVGGALGRNPLVLLVPCHRVISSAGGARALCGFTGGLPLKRWLLDLEEVIVR